MAKKSTLAKPPSGWVTELEALLTEPIQQLGFELLEVSIYHRSRKLILQVVIDAQNGINAEHCARVSHTVSALLDVHERIPHAFDLEVSSAGLFRPLREKRHFMQCIGKLIQVVVNEQFSRCSNARWASFPVLRGILQAVETEALVIAPGKQPLQHIPWFAIKKARLDPDLK